MTARQVFKRTGNDMGRYRQQYLYRCPKVSCQGQVVEPGALPAAAAIDWSHLGQRIGDRIHAENEAELVTAGITPECDQFHQDAEDAGCTRCSRLRTWAMVGTSPLMIRFDPRRCSWCSLL